MVRRLLAGCLQRSSEDTPAFPKTAYKARDRLASLDWQKSAPALSVDSQLAPLSARALHRPLRSALNDSSVRNFVLYGRERSGTGASHVSLWFKYDPF